MNYVFVVAGACTFAFVVSFVTNVILIISKIF